MITSKNVTMVYKVLNNVGLSRTKNLAASNFGRFLQTTVMSEIDFSHSNMYTSFKTPSSLHAAITICSYRSNAIWSRTGTHLPKCNPESELLVIHFRDSSQRYPTQEKKYEFEQDLEKLKKKIVFNHDVQEYKSCKPRRENVQERGPSEDVVEDFDSILQDEQILFGPFRNFRKVFERGSLQKVVLMVVPRKKHL
jgi:hypothetical protein